MIKKSFLKKVSILTVLSLLCSSFGSLSSFASESEIPGSTLEDVLASETVEGISTEVELDAKVLSEDFDLDEEVENMPSVDEMNKEEKELFNSIVQEQVAIAGLESEEEKMFFTKAMVDFFDERSETYNDLNLAQTELEEQVKNSNTSTDNSDDVYKFLQTF